MLDSIMLLFANASRIDCKSNFKESMQEDKENTKLIKHKILEAAEKQKRSHAVLEQRNKVVGAAESEVADLKNVENDIKARVDALDTRIAALNAKKNALLKSKQHQAAQVRMSRCATKHVRLFRGKGFCAFLMAHSCIGGKYFLF